MASDTPLISVITATYNRSNVLYYSIAGLLRSKFTDWELIVVGDACTDDTEEVVRSFRDPRIRFHNLEENVGDQAGPNNEGFRRSRGRYIAYLNHDDLWMPEHLGTALRGIEETGAEMVFTLGIAIRPGGANHLFNVPAGDTYTPTFVPASLWFLKREVLEEIGPWRHPRDCYLQPSQDLLLRIWKAGKKIISLPRVTVIAIQSGWRADVYARREYEENKFYFERMLREPDFLETELTAIARAQAAAAARLDIRSHFRAGAKNLLKTIALKLGFVPYEWGFVLRYRKKGEFINRWRKTIGLPDIK